MDNKKIAIIIVVFIAVFMAIVALLGIAGHIPFLGRALSVIIAVILIVFVVGFFAVLAKRKK
jgi:hypothetical protein